MKKDINRITFFNFLSILLLQGIAMISAPLFSRLLGTSGYGSLASFTAWSNMACIVLSLQSNETIVNARQEYDEQAQPGDGLLHWYGNVHPDWIFILTW